MDIPIICDAVDIFPLARYGEEKNPDTDHLRNPQRAVKIAKGILF